MQPVDRNPAFLWDMLEACRMILQFIEGKTYQQYLDDPLLQSAVERKLEVIGEAARRVSEDYQQQHPEISWRSLIGLRNILIHEYGEVRQDRIWLILQDHVPVLVGRLTGLIPPLPVDED